MIVSIVQFSALGLLTYTSDFPWETILSKEKNQVVAQGVSACEVPASLPCNDYSPRERRHFTTQSGAEVTQANGGFLPRYRWVITDSSLFPSAARYRYSAYGRSGMGEVSGSIRQIYLPGCNLFRTPRSYARKIFLRKCNQIRVLQSEG